MDTTLCILLSLNVISSPGTYTKAQISNFEQVYSLPISNIEHDPVLLDSVLITFEPEVPEIYIPDTVGN